MIDLRDLFVTACAGLFALVVMVLLAVICSVANAQEAQDSPRVVVAPEITAFPQNMIVVVDTSQSMDGDPFGRALDVFGILTDQSSDEWNLGVVAFGDTGVRWPADGEGWAAMPSADALVHARAWLRGVECGNSTMAWTGIDLATKDVPDGGLLVVVVSDGRWQDGPVVQAHLPARMAMHLPSGASASRLAIATYSVGEPLVAGMHREEWPRPIMLTIGRMGKGGCWR